MDKLLWNKKGFTLGEVVTVTAIIGTLTAIALPNFLRVKMNVNMEMVKQHLRVIGQEMNELMNQDPLHQFPADIFDLGTSPGEMTITASLSGIDNKGYTLDGYLTYANRSTYTFRTCPKEGLFGIAGDRCFILDTGVIRETDPWDADGVVMSIIDIRGMGNIDGNFNKILAEPILTQNQKILLMTDYMEAIAYALQMRRFQIAEQGNSALFNGSISAALLQFMDTLSVSSETNINTFKDLLPQIYAELKNRDITMTHKNITVTSDGNWASNDPVNRWLGYDSASPFDCGSSCIMQGSYSQVGFQFKNDINTLVLAQERYQTAVFKFLKDSQKYGITY